MNISVRLSGPARDHWFVLILPFLLLIQFEFARSTDWTRPGLAELPILFDVCLFVPLLFLLCYRRKLPARALVVRAAALFLLGIWWATWLVPPERRVVLAHLEDIRPIGLALIAIAELGLLLVVLRLVFSGGSSAEVAARSGAPEWIARLMLLEARFWKAVWRLIRRR